MHHRSPHLAAAAVAVAACLTIASPALAADTITISGVPATTAPGSTVRAQVTTNAAGAGSLLVYDDASSEPACAANSDAEEARGAGYVQTARYDKPGKSNTVDVIWTPTTNGQHALCIY